VKNFEYNLLYTSNGGFSSPAKIIIKISWIKNRKKLSKFRGTLVMRISVEANAAAETDISLVDCVFSEEEKGSVSPKRKFNITVEKKIERLWLDARQLDWDYQSFVVFILEVLTIMHYRNNLGQNQESVAAPDSDQQDVLR
jgi:hypothetical protein